MQSFSLLPERLNSIEEIRKAAPNQPLIEEDQSDVLTIIAEIKKRATKQSITEKNRYALSGIQLDVHRAMEGHADCFIEQEETKQAGEPRKIIINTPNANSLIEYDDIKVLARTLEKAQHLDAYVFYHGKLIPFADFCKKQDNDVNEALKKIDLISSNSIKETLNTEHSNYYILDYAEWIDIQESLQTKDAYIEKPEITIDASQELDALDVKAVNFLIQLGCSKITLIGKAGDDPQTIIDTFEELSTALSLSKMEVTLGIPEDNSDVILSFNQSSPCQGLTLDFNEEGTSHPSLTIKDFKDYSLTFHSLTCNTLNLSQGTDVKEIEFYACDIEQIIPCKTSIPLVHIHDSRIRNYKTIINLQTLHKNNEIMLSQDTIDLFNQEEKRLLKERKEEPDEDETAIIQAFASSPSENESFGKPCYEDAPALSASRNIKTMTGENISPRKYRNTIFTQLDYDATAGITFKPFVPNKENTKNVDLTTLPREKKPIYSGIVILRPNHWVALPSLSAYDELVSLNTPTEPGLTLEVCYADETQQYFAKISSPSPIFKKIYLKYAMAPNEPVTPKETKPLSIPISADLKKFMELDIASIQTPLLKKTLLTLQSLKLPNPQVGEKRKRLEDDQETTWRNLISFCQEFKDQDIPEDAEAEIQSYLTGKHESLQYFFLSLLTQSGVCDHRSKVFMALANYLGLPARLISNDLHAYVEYFYQGSWLFADLGGGGAEISYKDIWEEEKSITGAYTIRDEFGYLFNFGIKKLTAGQGFPVWFQELLNLPSHPFLYYSNKKDAFELHSLIISLPTINLHDNYIYIHEARDIERFLKQHRIQPNGECEEIPGPLKTMIGKTRDTIIILINWSHFSPLEIVSYKSLLDTTPTLQGHAITANIKVISIVQSSKILCETLTSRTQEIIWPTHFSPIAIQKITELEEAKAPIDLFEDVHGWEKTLIGQPKISPAGFLFEEGALIKKIQQKTSSICLTGIPKCPAYEAFLERLQRERGFFANGLWHSLPAEFTLYTSKLLRDEVILPAIHRPSSFVCYVNRQTFNLLFEKYFINIKEKKVEPRNGLLKEIPPDATLVLTDELSRGDLRRLQIELKTSYPHIQLYQKKKAFPKTKTSSYVVLTNDIETSVRKIKTPDDIIVNISEVMKFSDLFETISLENKSEHTMTKRFLRFNYSEHELLTYLRQGKNIILKGDIAPELYHRIESIFSPKSYLIINGESVKISASLKLVTSKKIDNPDLFDSAYCETHQFDLKPANINLEITHGNTIQARAKKVSEIFKKSSFISFHGIPGTGKTHFIKHAIPKHQCYWGEDSIIPWLTSKDYPNYLLLDEANMKKPGYWDFLKGLNEGQIYYKGKFYPVSPKTHYVIFTENPDHYPGRYHHAFLQQVPKVHFTPYTEQDLIRNVSLVLDEMNLSIPGFALTIVNAYQLAQQKLPKEILLSYRELMSLLDRFKSYKPKASNVFSNAYLASIEIFGGLFKHAPQRQDFLDELRAIFSNGEELIFTLALLETLPAIPNYFIPNSKQLLWTDINDSIRLREYAFETSSTLTRAGFLVEGPSGIGKSEMMLQALKQRGYQPYREEKKLDSKTYFHVTMGSRNIHEIISKAFKQSAILVIDELNVLTEKDADLLNNLLEGSSPLEKAPHPGFYVLASQNPSFFPGRKSLSLSLLNRFDCFYEENYTPKDLGEIAQKANTEPTRAFRFVKRFLSECEKNPALNARNFFKALNADIATRAAFCGMRFFSPTPLQPRVYLPATLTTRNMAGI